MGFDYYGILGVKRSSSQIEIKKAYRRLALKYNPERHENDENMLHVFTLVAEAYEVLVDNKTRSIYDQYGEEGLKRGVPGPDGYIHPYVFHSDPFKTYREFFGTNNPYADILDYYNNPAPMFDSPLGKGYKEKDQSITRQLLLTLEEVYKGCLKKMKIQRLVFTDETCSELKLKEKVLTIPIKPGIYEKTEITFKEEGDQGPTKIPADVVFIIEDRPHETYARLNKSDLLYKKTITLEEALCGFTINLKSLDERQLRIQVTDVIRPNQEMIIRGEGLPIYQCPKVKGNLVIRFDVTFPADLTKKSKKAFAEAFKIHEDEEKKYEELPCGVLPDTI